MISDIFQRTTANEKEHAELWYKELIGIGDTQANLTLAAENENYEWREMYSRFAVEADAEDFTGLAERFRLIATIEKRYEECRRDLLRLLESGKMFARNDLTIRECCNCGRIIIAEEAPESCPTCQHPQSYYQLFAENY